MKKDIIVTAILALLLMLISGICANDILTYFLGSYYKIANYDIKNNVYKCDSSKNIDRVTLETAESNLWKCNKERMLLKDTLNMSRDAPEASLGSIPEAPLISTYKGERNGKYVRGKTKWNYFDSYTAIVR